MRKWYWGLGSIALCLVTAGVFALAFRASSYKSFLPFVFVGVIVLVAKRFGSWPGILGTLGAAGVFAVFLFEPAFSLRVSDTAQRTNLIWMVIIGIVASEILGLQPKVTTHSNTHGTG